jgi:prepilin-type N-terminal cleavage/methylation domain-containing protein
MKPKSDNCWSYSCRNAFTLVEVVASLMLLGTLLVAILMAHREHAKQIRNASIRLKAIEVADKLFAEWSEKGMWGTAKASGEVPDFPWRWTVLPSPELRRLGASIGRLEIFAADRVDQAPMVQVEVLTTDTIAVPQARNDVQ